jgi:hypothetical protein
MSVFLRRVRATPNLASGEQAAALRYGICQLLLYLAEGNGRLRRGLWEKAFKESKRQLSVRAEKSLMAFMPEALASLMGVQPHSGLDACVVGRERLKATAAYEPAYAFLTTGLHSLSREVSQEMPGLTLEKVVGRRADMCGPFCQDSRKFVTLGSSDELRLRRGLMSAEVYAAGGTLRRNTTDIREAQDMVEALRNEAVAHPAERDAAFLHDLDALERDIKQAERFAWGRRGWHA